MDKTTVYYVDYRRDQKVCSCTPTNHLCRRSQSTFGLTPRFSLSLRHKLTRVIDTSKFQPPPSLSASLLLVPSRLGQQRSVGEFLCVSQLPESCSSWTSWRQTILHQSFDVFFPGLVLTPDADAVLHSLRRQAVNRESFVSQKLVCL